MAILNAQETFDKIKSFIDEHDNNYPKWYSGIASDPRKRLFEEHNVSEDSDLWIFQRCPNEQNARNVEERLLKLGCDGSTGGGDASSVYAYAYRKSANTNV
jgi:hypothetical protein